MMFDALKIVDDDDDDDNYDDDDDDDKCKIIRSCFRIGSVEKPCPPDGE